MLCDIKIRAYILQECLRYSTWKIRLHRKIRIDVRSGPFRLLLITRVYQFKI